MTNSIRKTKVPYGILTASCLAASSLIHATPQADTILISGQKTEVVVCPGAPEPTRFAACEMTNHLSKIFGIDVPLVTKPTDGRYSIILGTNGWSRAAGLAPETLKRDSFCVRIERGRAFIAGCDDPKCSIGDMLKSGRTVPFERATFFGVYGFLDRHAGVRFYFPGELGTVVPRSDSIGLPVGSYSVTPRFSARDCYIGGAGPYPGIAADDRKAQSRAKARYRLFLREETERVRCCHGQNAFRIAERFSESRPEYFQLRKNGTRCTGTKFAKNWMGRQLCHTSKVWDIFRRETVERIRKGEKYVDVMPQDGMSPCWCDTCQKTFNTTNFNLASGYATELIWSNTVEIAKAVAKAGLNGGVSQMAYGTYRNIPSVDIPENVKVVLAVGGPWSESHPDIRDKQIDFIRIWAEKLKRPVDWIWTYPMKNYGRLQAPDVPQVAPRAFAKFYELAEPYINGSFVESNVGETLVQNYLNFYVYSKIAWDGKIDIDRVLSEHHRLMFGAGADAMSAFFEALEEKWIKEVAVPSLIGETEIGPMLYGPSEIELWENIYSRAFIARLEEYLKSANSAVAAGTIESRRIAWIKSELFDRLANRSKKYLDSMSVDVERSRRAANPNAVVLVDSDKGWKGWSVSKDMICDDGSLKVTSKNKRYVGFGLVRNAALKPNTSYRLSYFLRTENLKSLGRNGGACMEVEQFGTVYSADRVPKSKYWNGTRDWIHQSMEFKTNGDPLKKGYRASLWLRIFNSEGTAWFDGVRLEELSH